MSVIRGRGLWATFLVLAMLLAACGDDGGATETTAASGGADTTVADSDSTEPVELLVWADEVRSEMVKLYAESHPEVSVEIVTVPYTISAYQQKLSLQNQAGEGWPDVWGVPGPLLYQFSEAPYDFAADLTDLVPDGFEEQFASGALEQCRINGALKCVPYQVSPFAFFYNVPAFEELGYDVPETWEEYYSLGLQVAAENPDYVMGVSAGGGVLTSRAFLSSSGCPDQILLDAATILNDLSDPKCQRAIENMDALLAGGVLPASATNDPDFLQEHGTSGKWLTMIEPIFQIKNLFQKQFEAPPGTVGIAPPLHWEGEEPLTGRTGGTAFMVSRHSEQKEAALELANWLATGDVVNDPSTVTVPAHLESLQLWTETMEESGYLVVNGDSLAAVFEEAIAAINPEISDIPVDNIFWKQVVAPELALGSTIADAMPIWEEAIRNEAGAAGFEVVSER